MKDTERYLSSMLKHFDGKESDTNWEAREQTIAHIREIVQTTNTPDEKQSLARLLRSYVDALTQSVHSLRSTVALSALGLIHTQQINSFFTPSVAQARPKKSLPRTQKMHAQRYYPTPLIATASSNK
ncbi:hypothetical protein BDB00DRAFT_783732 [Zychaea mexicana]|uniref:uncharacterized protein n=1 Tax=Zychaea mexicana TaxID=64656 RepID=UPI0022FE9DEE|nr:uncharacterized protein BDB00DRAFT_783732 [Zychaea mexicana]KAI9498591.1 hypothetical protein BDB00DRAFT_783732 [Zychaea mexicana]